ncbi:MAG TPA: response regulator [Candidatus Acidoferrales bacterium]|jgi:two-component system sensor histidine kinase and response regulator WspE|nr:response regulator [Candidatus Acidoferrales bacterium]
MKNRGNQTVEGPNTAPIQARTKPKRILVVDDDSDIRQFSVDILTDSGYEVDGAKDGADGWDALQASTYDLVITDNQMPRMTGMEMIGKLRAAYMTLPVILATRYVPRYELSLRPWLEPDALLERPFSNDDLLGAVKKFLGPDAGGDEVKVSLLPRYL